MFDQKIFGEKLKNHRKSLNLTQEEIAEKIGVSGQAVSKWENGECLPDCYNLKQLGDIFGISLDILLDTDKNKSIDTVAKKIKQIATEFVWDKYGAEEKNDYHLELGNDLWEMWKAVYFVEIGNKDLQEREMIHGNNRISGSYGMKAWDNNGFACVIKSSLMQKLELVKEKELKILQTLTSDDYFILLKNIDNHNVFSKEKLMEKTGYDSIKLNEMLLYLVENKIIEYFINRNSEIEGYKFTANRGIISYLVLSTAYLLTSSRHSTSEYLPS